MQNDILYRRGASPSLVDASCLHRPRIDAMLLAAIEKPLTTVVADAGCGKTQAVSTLYDTADAHILWLQLTEMDNYASRLWGRVGHALAAHNRTLADEVLLLGDPQSIGALNRFMTLLAEEIARTKVRYIVVLDDFDVLFNAQILQNISLMMAAPLSGLSLVIISNKEPQMDLVPLVQRGMVSRIIAQDLHFTREEMAAYFELQGIPLPPSDIGSLHEYTGGWVFAVYLIALSMQKSGNVEFRHRPETITDIYALIERSVYLPMPPERKLLFLQLSFLIDIPPSLLHMLAEGNTEMVLQTVRQHGALLHYDISSGSYQMTTLFRDYLRGKHSELSKQERDALYMRVAAWYEANDDRLKALVYYECCESYAHIFQMILTFDYRCPKEIADLFIRLIQKAPPQAIAESPMMQVVCIKFMLNNLRVAEGYEALRCLQAEYETREASPGQQSMLGEIYTMLGIFSFVMKTTDFPAFFQQADALLPLGSAIVSSKLALVVGARFFSIHDLAPGSVKRTMDAFFAARQHATRVMNGCGEGLDHLVAAEGEYACGKVKEAEKNAYAALYQAQRAGQDDIENMAHAVLLRIALYHGDYQRVAIMLETLDKRLKKNQRPDCAALCDIIIGRFYAHIELPPKIPPWILDEADSPDALAPISMHRGQMVRASYYLSQGRYGQIIPYLDELDRRCRAQNNLFGLIENTVLRAVAHHYAKEEAAALEALRASYLLCRDNGLIMFHVEQGKRMRALIRAAKQHGETGIPQEWLDAVHTKAVTYAKRLAMVAQVCAASAEEHRKIQLTRREREVLNCLCQGLTREQIAQSCGLSVNTVKSLLPLLYEKLGATTRLDAVRIAATLNLL